MGHAPPGGLDGIRRNLSAGVQHRRDALPRSYRFTRESEPVLLNAVRAIARRRILRRRIDAAYVLDCNSDRRVPGPLHGRRRALPAAAERGSCPEPMLPLDSEQHRQFNAALNQLDVFVAGRRGNLSSVFGEAMSIHSSPCCSSCADHGGHCGGKIGTIRKSTVSPYGRIGDVSCDQDNNCYDSSTGIFTPAPVFSQYAPISANLNSASTWLSQNSAMLTGLAAAVGILALVMAGKGRRR